MTKYENNKVYGLEFIFKREIISICCKKTVEKKVNIEPAQIYIEWKKYLERLLLESGL